MICHVIILSERKHELKEKKARIAAKRDIKHVERKISRSGVSLPPGVTAETLVKSRKRAAEEAADDDDEEEDEDEEKSDDESRTRMSMSRPSPTRPRCPSSRRTSARR